jgi:hypothetical protein
MFAFRLVLKTKFLAEDIHRSDLDLPTKRVVIAMLEHVAQAMSPNVEELHQADASTLIREIHDWSLP